MLRKHSVIWLAVLLLPLALAQPVAPPPPKGKRPPAAKTPPPPADAAAIAAAAATAAAAAAATSPAAAATSPPAAAATTSPPAATSSPAAATPSPAAATPSPAAATPPPAASPSPASPDASPSPAAPSPEASPPGMAAPPAGYVLMKMVLKLVGAPYPLSEEQADAVAASISTLTVPVNWTFRVQQPSAPDQLPVAPRAKILTSIDSSSPVGPTTTGAVGGGATGAATTAAAGGRRRLQRRLLQANPCTDLPDDFEVPNVDTCGTECTAKQEASPGSTVNAQFYNIDTTICCTCNLVEEGSDSPGNDSGGGGEPPPFFEPPPLEGDDEDAGGESPSGQGGGSSPSSPTPSSPSPSSPRPSTPTPSPPKAPSPPPPPPPSVRLPPPPVPTAVTDLGGTPPVETSTWYTTSQLPVPINRDGVFYFCDAWMDSFQAQPVANQLVKSQGQELTSTIRDGTDFTFTTALLEFVGTGALAFNALSPYAASAAPPSDSSDGGLSTAAIVGIVVGVVVGIAILAALIIVVMKRRKNNKPLVTKGMGVTEETMSWRDTYNRRLQESMRRTEEVLAHQQQSLGKSKSFGRSPSRSLPPPVTEMASRSSGPELTRDSASNMLATDDGYSAEVPEGSRSGRSKMKFWKK